MLIRDTLFTAIDFESAGVSRGGTDAAIAEWKKIQDYLDEKSSARVLIQQADSNYQDYWQRFLN